MAEFWQSDSWIDNHYRNRWEDVHGYDPLDPPEDEEEEEDDWNESDEM